MRLVIRLSTSSWSDALREFFLPFPRFINKAPLSSKCLQTILRLCNPPLRFCLIEHPISSNNYSRMVWVISVIQPSYQLGPHSQRVCLNSECNLVLLHNIDCFEGVRNNLDFCYWVDATTTFSVDDAPYRSPDTSQVEEGDCYGASEARTWHRPTPS